MNNRNRTGSAPMWLYVGPLMAPTWLPDLCEADPIINRPIR